MAGGGAHCCFDSDGQTAAKDHQRGKNGVRAFVRACEGSPTKVMLFEVLRFSELGDFHLFWDGTMETPGVR